MVDSEMRRLKEGAVRPTFKKTPRWHADRGVQTICLLLMLMPLTGLIMLMADIGTFCVSLLLLFIALPMVGFGTLFYWLMIHEMETVPTEGKYGMADPDQAYKGLVLILRDLLLELGYGFKLVRGGALVAFNYEFTVIPERGSKERLWVTALKCDDYGKLKISIYRDSGVRRRTYIKFKNAIEKRLARQVL